MTDTPYSLEKSILRQQSYGVLSTHSTEVPGYPFGSVTSYSLDQDGLPILFLSDTALHSQNIKADAKICLTILETDTGNIQTKARLSLPGYAFHIDKHLPAAKRYFRYFPAHKDFINSSFSFYKLKLSAAYLVGGFAKTAWVDPDQLAGPNPFFGEAEIEFSEWAMTDHQETLQKWCRQYKQIEIPDHVLLYVAGLDSSGFDVLVGELKLRFPFLTSAYSLDEAKLAFETL